MSDFYGPSKERIYFYRTNLLTKIGTISFNVCLPTRNKFFFYASIIKFSRPIGYKFIECRFSILWIPEAFLLQEIIEMFEKVKICR